MLKDKFTFPYLPTSIRFDLRARALGIAAKGRGDPWCRRQSSPPRRETRTLQLSAATHCSLNFTPNASFSPPHSKTSPPVLAYAAAQIPPLEVAVKCGGIHPSTWASSNGGVVTGLSKINKVVHTENKETILVQDGAVWGDVYAVTGAAGIDVVGSPLGSWAWAGLRQQGDTDRSVGSSGQAAQRYGRARRQAYLHGEQG